MEELSKSILMGNKSAFEITMETSLKFIPLLFEHYGYLFRNDTKVKKVIFSKERHYDAVVTRSVIGNVHWVHCKYIHWPVLEYGNPYFLYF